MKNIKNKKSILAIIVLAMMVMIGGTLAYFRAIVLVDNTFTAASYNVELIETFVSPTNWTPGDETSKVVTVKNNSSEPVRVRIKLEEEWKDEDGTTSLPLFQDGNRIALINFTNTNKWLKSGEYYYYDGTLNANATTESIINQVTFNPLFSLGESCHMLGSTRVSCTSRGEEYNDGSYTLKVIAEFAQADAYLTAWDITAQEITTPTSFVLDFDTNGGLLSSYKQVVTNGETYSLPTPTKTGYTFEGWFLDSTFTQASEIENGDTISLNEDKVVYAKWEEVVSP